MADPCTDDRCSGGDCSNPPILGIDGAQCLLAALVPASVCGSDPIDPKLLGTMTKKRAKATTLLGRAEAAPTDAKRAKFVKKAGKSLRPIVTKATKLATKGKISAACAATIGDAIAAIQQALGELTSSPRCGRAPTRPHGLVLPTVRHGAGVTVRVNGPWWPSWYPSTTIV